jgi:hypothetical protein
MFPGMPDIRKIDIVWVVDGHGTGVNPTANPDTTVIYRGEEILLKEVKQNQKFGITH